MIFPNTRVLRATGLVWLCLGDLILYALSEWCAMFGSHYNRDWSTVKM